MTEGMNRLPATNGREYPACHFRFQLRWYHHFADFANLLKAFIGTNYFGLAFAFRQSGLTVIVLDSCVEKEQVTCSQKEHLIMSTK